MVDVAASQAVLPASPDEALRALWGAERVGPSWFSSAFLDHVPARQVDQVLAELRTALGAYQSARCEDGRCTVTFANGTMPARIRADGEGRLTTLWFGPPSLTASTIESTVEALRALPGRVSVLVLEDGTERAAVTPDEPLGVGSAFKLAVLAALQDRVTARALRWGQVVELDPAWRSLPSGTLQTWPPRTPVTLATLAAMMISESDNTATDALIHVVGRAEVERAAPARVRPFLTTREVFVLKTPANEALLTSFRAGDEAQRRALLPELAARPLPTLNAYPDTPTALDVEWFFSARELCALMARVEQLPLMSINPGVAERSSWDHIAFKGGSEPGVLNATTWLVRGSHRYCVAATWNATTLLTASRFMSLYSGVLSALAAHSTP